ncbi:4'-phosphopantetheinyl transferase family protein [Microbacterium sp. NPDC056569]|uniref:4'-phosphopantetheinyl transferase family protein n=1 Tax=Microbacterium sp. NPDC056569 TaxID=3345867 RepID=UPI00366D8B4E
MTAEVWWADPGWLQSWHHELLDPTERARAARHRLETDRANFVVAAALLRLVAGRRLGLPPERVTVDRRCPRCGEPHGRPTIVGARFSVSIAHSARRVMLGLSTDGTVGVDVERVSPIDLSGLWPLVHSPEEAPSAQTHEGFFRTWVRKEAVLKSLGTGLATPMTSVVLGQSGAPPSVLSVGNRPALDLVLADVDADTGYSAAIANLPAGDRGAFEASGGATPLAVEVHRDAAAALLGAPAPPSTSSPPHAR